MRSGWSVILAIGASAAVVAIASRRWGASGPEETAAPQNVDMNPERTTKSQRGTRDVPLETSSPIGHEEIESEMAVEAKGDS